MYLFISVGRPWDVELDKGGISFKSPPTSFSLYQLRAYVYRIILSGGDLQGEIIGIPLESSGANKEMPMNTNVIPNRNIVILSVSNTC